MNVVDSSGWLEYFADAENAAFFESAIEDVDHLVVPSINLYEVFNPDYSSCKHKMSKRARHVESVHPGLFITQT